MSEKEKLVMSELTTRATAELSSMLVAKTEELRKARFKHALGQLKQTHTLRATRRSIARLQTALGFVSRREAGEQA